MVRKKGKGRAVKSAKQKFGAHYESDEIKFAPHTMVINRGIVGKDLKELMADMRHVMEPYTASSLKVKKKNSLRDFVSIAGPMHVTHLLLFTKTDAGDYLKIVRMPRGPTLHFKLEEFSTANDVLTTMRKKHTHQKQLLYQPLLILNGFSTKAPEETVKAGSVNNIELHHKLISTTLQNMFSSINVTKVHLDDMRRCVLFNYNKADDTIDFRQYNIRLMPVGLSKPVKKLVQEKLPDLSQFQDISEFMESQGLFSESEAELDGPNNEVKLTQDVKSKGAVNLKNSTSAVRLSEIGPRMKLRLIKIQEGICDGEVLYHEFITKTPEELAVIRANMKARKKAEKEKQKKVANDNALIEKRGNKKHGKKGDANKHSGVDIDGYEYKGDEVDDIDDTEYYKQELGQEPDTDVFSSTKRKRKNGDTGGRLKRHKPDAVEKHLMGEDAAPPKVNKPLVSFAKSANEQPRSAKFLGFSKKKKQTNNSK